MKREQPLSPQKAQFVDAYMAVGTVPDASDLVGIDRTTGWRWLQQPVVAEQIRLRLEGQAHRSRAALNARQDAAWSVVDVLLTSPDEKVRLRLVTWLIELKLRQVGPTPKSIAEVQIEALERQVQDELAQRTGTLIP
ncbi:MAG: hypothetical protein QOE83_335 [Actinomycetota bacterium]|jgi:hypothetical protein|nr:hypothetical protein [Actinomycetota bacterium]